VLTSEDETWGAYIDYLETNLFYLLYMPQNPGEHFDQDFAAILILYCSFIKIIDYCVL